MHYKKGIYHNGYTKQRLRNFYFSNMSNLNVSPESTVPDHSKTGCIFDIAPLLKK